VYYWCSGRRIITCWVSYQIWDWGGWKLGFWGEKSFFSTEVCHNSPRRATTWQRAVFARHLLATANYSVTESSVCSPRRVS